MTEPAGHFSVLGLGLLVGPWVLLGGVLPGGRVLAVIVGDGLECGVGTEPQLRSSATTSATTTRTTPTEVLHTRTLHPCPGAQPPPPELGDHRQRAQPLLQHPDHRDLRPLPPAATASP